MGLADTYFCAEDIHDLSDVITTDAFPKEYIFYEIKWSTHN